MEHGLGLGGIVRRHAWAFDAWAFDPGIDCIDRPRQVAVLQDTGELCDRQFRIAVAGLLIGRKLGLGALDGSEDDQKVFHCTHSLDLRNG